MKKLLTIISLIGVASLAYAQATRVKTVSLANSAVEPTGTSTGVPTQIPGPAAGQVLVLKTLSVTAKEPDDGGNPGQDLNTLALRAWRYTKNAQLADAGVNFAWTRMPQFDMKYDSDAGAAANGYLLHNHGLNLYMTIASPLPAGGLITYTQHAGLGVDGGSVNLDLILEGVYGPVPP